MSYYHVRFSVNSSNVEFTATTGYLIFHGTPAGNTISNGEIDNLFSSEDGINSIHNDILDHTSPIPTITINPAATTTTTAYTSITGNVSTTEIVLAGPLMKTQTLHPDHWKINSSKQVFYSDDFGSHYFTATGVTVTFTSIVGPVTSQASPLCFIEGAKLYAHVHDKDIYINIEDLRTGDLVNTYLHGKKAIKFIGKGSMINNPSKWNGCVRRLPKSGEMIDDLLVTGAHSILVDELSEKETEGIIAIYGTADRKIDDKILVNSWVSEQ